MTRRCSSNNGTPMNHGSVFNGSPPSTGGDPVAQPVIDGEPLCEVCALVDGVPQWITPFICIDTQTKERQTIYLDAIGQEITGVITLQPAEACVNCEQESN